MHHFQEMLLSLPFNRISHYIEITTPYVRYVFWSMTIIRGISDGAKFSVKGISFIAKKFNRKTKTK